MVTKIDKITNSIAEYGFYQCYDSYMEIKLKHLAHIVGLTIIKDEFDIESITINKLRKPIIIVLCLNGIATIAFVVEIFIFKWLEWRNCKHLNKY